MIKIETLAHSKRCAVASLIIWLLKNQKHEQLKKEMCKLARLIIWLLISIGIIFSFYFILFRVVKVLAHKKKNIWAVASFAWHLGGGEGCWCGCAGEYTHTHTHTHTSPPLTPSFSLIGMLKHHSHCFAVTRETRERFAPALGHLPSLANLLTCLDLLTY
jgi:hypothetical protein